MSNSVSVDQQTSVFIPLYTAYIIFPLILGIEVGEVISSMSSHPTLSNSAYVDLSHKQI